MRLETSKHVMKHCGCMEARGMRQGGRWVAAWRKGLISLLRSSALTLKACVWILSEERRKVCLDVGSKKIKLGVWRARLETGRLVGRASAVLGHCERESSWLSH